MYPFQTQTDTSKKKPAGKKKKKQRKVKGVLFDVSQSRRPLASTTIMIIIIRLL
jgi:hypothetical protein